MGTFTVAGRTRSMGVLFAGVALLNTATVGLTTAATLIVAAGSGTAWSGLPSVASVLGTAGGALGAGLLLPVNGRRRVLVAGYGTAALGALVAFAAALATSVLPLLLGILLVGVGNGGAQLSRYLAADLYPPERRGRALATVVWAGTIGALAGPALMAPAAHVVTGFGWPSLSGPVAVAVVATAAAALAAVLLPRDVPPPRVRAARGPVRSPAVVRPLAAMVGAQLAMVAVMTMTPLQLQSHGHGLGTVGWVLSAHLAGMFALAPLSGRIADRWGPAVTVNAGLGVLALASATALAAPAAHTSGLPLALFLLGYGWNLVFVGGSAQLSRDLAPATRSRVQGTVDAVVWSASALAGLGSGQLFAGGGYALVAVVGGVLALLPLALLVPRDRR
ncbi:Predicted arabinose efflux permease, MFS family [Amycolatopsis tolypomycina]|uniref:Predicted arabinose efflux permease, MFS family n=1 Tax=Amycolatopsis tolypomycina TaxID=208445 RepID=A0A1H4ILY9_9PSEU|nr:MFS transporter [Amycolatopsis tolypomycina]SEB34943.1 Predicted arabinose efflux permease, MFS family [Amycolatopsis tolypomycina]